MKFPKNIFKNKINTPIITSDFVHTEVWEDPLISPLWQNPDHTKQCLSFGQDRRKGRSPCRPSSSAHLCHLSYLDICQAALLNPFWEDTWSHLQKWVAGLWHLLGSCGLWQPLLGSWKVCCNQFCSILLAPQLFPLSIILYHARPDEDPGPPSFLS